MLWGIELLENFMCAIDGSDLYFYTYPDGDLVSMKITDGKISFYDEYIKVGFNDISNYLSISNNKLVRVGNKADKITIFDTVEGKEIEIRIESNLSSLEGSRVINIYSYKNHVYVLLKNCNYLYDYDSTQNKVIKRMLPITNGFGYDDGYRVGNTLWLVRSDTNNISLIDLENLDSSEISMSKDIGGIRYITGNHKFAYVLTHKSDIYRFDKENKQLILIYKNDSRQIDVERIHISMDEKTIILLPTRNSSDIYLYKDNTLIKYEDYPNQFKYIRPEQYKYVRYAEDDEKIIYPMRASNAALLINKDCGTISWIIPQYTVADIQKHIIRKGTVIQETDNTTLCGFINSL